VGYKFIKKNDSLGYKHKIKIFLKDYFFLVAFNNFIKDFLSKIHDVEYFQSF